MNRRDFVRLLGQATACTIVAPYVPDVFVPFEDKPKIDFDFDLREVTTSLKVAGYLRVSSAMLDDLPMLTFVLQQKGLELSQNDPDWEGKTEIEIAEDGDSFLHGSKTVIFSYKKASIT